MRAARLAAVTAAASVATGVAALGMAGPALAAAPAAPQAAKPQASVTPNPFKPGASLTIKITECVEAPTGTAGQIFTTTPKFTGTAGGTWTSVTATKASLKPGTSYKATFTCKVADGTQTLTLTVNPAKDTTEPPKFSFGYDDVKLSTRKVIPGKTLGFTVNCPTTVTITGNGFTTKSLAVRKSGNTHKAVGTFRSGNLPDPTNVTVACKGYGYVKYSTKPGKAIKPGKKSPTIPVGAPQTGDGSLYMEQHDGGSAMPAVVGGSAAALVVAGGGLVLLRRRNAGREQA